ncbi:hypothetical protein GCM10027280_50010 [Micromonospora polyrhachis]|uniref:Uncharacterized protein n=1 Tax=Micromonospora polyrhachis TaxID=1282883 RepID=A0A7W7SW41_9ACTN|nr:SitI3 family protein [Micromonospora polyrhachis]MBB4960750.1 hypothetical protein [Micromonospora polyrhachis]
MSINYRLTLAGNIPLEQVAEFAAPTAVETSTLSGGRMLSADLSDQLGYAVSITAGSGGYYDAEDDNGEQWVWEPDPYVDVNFHMRKDMLAEKGTLNMIKAVGRVLAARPEDAALVLNGNWLMLTRVGGELRKHNVADWFDEEYVGILPD